MPNRPPTHRPPRLPTPDTRPTAAARGYNARWRRARAVFLALHPECSCTHPRCCGEQGCNRPATVVDHVIPHRGDYGKMWNVDNFQAMCETCHNRKTARGE